MARLQWRADLADFLARKADSGASRRVARTRLWGRPAATKWFLDNVCASSQGFPTLVVLSRRCVTPYAPWSAMAGCCGERVLDNFGVSNAARDGSHRAVKM
jgi:hypothetical protein